MRKRTVILLKQLIPGILRLKYLKVLSVKFVVLLASTFTLMMVKSVLSLSVKSALPSLKYTLVIGIKLNIIDLIVVIHFIFGKSEEMSLFINVIMTDAPVF